MGVFSPLYLFSFLVLIFLCAFLSYIAVIGGLGDPSRLFFKDYIRSNENSSPKNDNVVQFLVHATNEVKIRLEIGKLSQIK